MVKAIEMNSFTGEGALDRARRFLAEKADQVEYELRGGDVNMRALDSKLDIKIIPSDSFLSCLNFQEL